MMKAARSPPNATLLITMPEMAKTTRLKPTKPQATTGAAAPKKRGVMKARTIIRAVQGTRGANMMVSSRPRRDSITRVPITAGTLQPKPRNKGRKLLPCKPIKCMKRSITYAARAI